MASVCFIGGASAITVDEYQSYYNNPKISLPSQVSSTGTSVTVSSSVASGYKLYYQWISLSSSDYLKMEQIEKEMKQISDDFAKYTESAVDTTSEEYANKTEEYRTQLNTKINEFLELIPNYNESNWKSVDDGNKVKFENNNYSTLWIKLVETDNTTSYTFNVYENSKVSDNVGSVTDKTQQISQDNKEYADDNEDDDDEDGIKSTQNPNTGINDTIAYLVPLMLVAGSAMVFKRYRHN